MSIKTTPEAGLLERTYAFLDATALTYREIAVGASVDINWLAKLKQRAIEEPGVLKIQRVHDFLAAHQNNAPDDVRVPMQSA